MTQNEDREPIADDPIDYLIELRGVYDGWSIAVHKDGSLHNRWAAEDGSALPGYEGRWKATESAIAERRARSAEPPEA